MNVFSGHQTKDPVCKHKTKHIVQKYIIFVTSTVLFKFLFKSNLG